MITLDQMLAPMSVEIFLSDTYEQSWLRKSLSQPDAFRQLISIERIDHLLAGQSFHSDELNMARSDPPIQRQDFIRENDLADKGAVARAFQEGATLILPQLHARVPELADFCRGLEAVFSAHVQTNIYLTPQGSQGFQTHYDNHCVFILQVEGVKRWRLYDSPTGIPFRGERFTPGQYAPGEVREEFLLEPGDILYVPRGMMHDAISEPDHASLHVTTGIITKTWADFVLEAVSETALKSDDLRRALPAGHHTDDFDRSSIRPMLKRVLHNVAETADTDAVLDLFIDTFIRSRQARLDSALSNGKVGSSDQFRKRELIPLRLAEADDTHLALIAPGGDIIIDNDAEAGLDSLIAGQTLTVDSFRPMTPDKARNVLERLLAFGVVERV